MDEDISRPRFRKISNGGNDIHIPRWRRVPKMTPMKIQEISHNSGTVTDTAMIYAPLQS